MITIENIKAEFSLGKVCATRGAIDALIEMEGSPILMAQLIARHARKDWGDLCDEDKALNDAALVDGSRLLSCYVLADEY